jgi:FkbM family methyltransferase
MILFPDRMRRALSRIVRQVDCCRNGLRFGFVFVRARSFKIPQKIRVAGKSVPLRLPPEHGALVDFFVCFLRNEYGLQKRMSDVQTILDIGANLGFFSIAARSHYPRAIIHAYEPNPRVLPFLEANTSELGIAVYPEAVGGQSGRVSMDDSGDSNLARTVVNSDGSVPQVSLATAIERLGGTVDMLKLDCEGAEWEMFGIAEPWQHIRNVRMEYHLFKGETVQDVERNLNGLGFEVIHWKPDLGFGTVWASRAE